MAPLRVAMLVCYSKMKKELSDAFSPDEVSIGSGELMME